MALVTLVTILRVCDSKGVSRFPSSRYLVPRTEMPASAPVPKVGNFERLAVAMKAEVGRRGFPFSMEASWFRIELDAKRVLVVRGSGWTTDGIIAIYAKKEPPGILEVQFELVANGDVHGWRERGTIFPLYDDDTLAAALLEHPSRQTKQRAPRAH